MSRWSLSMQYWHPTLKTVYGPCRLCNQIPDFPAVSKGVLMQRQSYVMSYFYGANYNFIQLEASSWSCNLKLVVDTRDSPTVSGRKGSVGLAQPIYRACTRAPPPTIRLFLVAIEIRVATQKFREHQHSCWNNCQHPLFFCNVIERDRPYSSHINPH